MSGWARVIKGLNRVTTNGASRITNAVITSSVANKHIPELTNTIIKAGSQHAATVQSYYDKVNSTNNANLKNREDDFDSSIIKGDSVYRSSTDNDAHHTSSSDYVSQQDDGRDIQVKDMEQDDISKQVDISFNDDTHNSYTLASKVQPLDISLNAAIQSGNIDTISTKTKTQSTTTTSTNDNHIHTESATTYNDEHQTNHLPEGSAVPSGRVSRAFGFAQLGAGLAMGTLSELAKRTIGQSTSSDPIVLSNDANAQRLSDSLRRMRGAAMKLGQMLSIQDESIAPPALTNALAQVRKSAEAMPQYQLQQQLTAEWGENWKDEIELEDRPFAAASIGQVHRGTLRTPSSDDGITKVAVKVQYPGVADSIESDLSNLTMLVKATGLSPPGLFLDNVIKVGRDELKIECDYQREVANQQRFQKLISSDSNLVADRFVVPKVINELCTNRILVTELVSGGTIDKVVDLDQAERNRIGRAIMRLTMLELFVWRFMQTDPNWGNFLYDVRTRTTYLIDFGAAREYDEEFVQGYLNIVIANANRDEEALMKESIKMGFLTGEENEIMLEAHKMSGFCLGEPFQSYKPYDFKNSKVTSRISEHGAVFLQHRLTPPPEEVYTLHRKLAGAYNLCIKLGAKISCRDILDEVIESRRNKS